jgi:hypothetical protein
MDVFAKLILIVLKEHRIFTGILASGKTDCAIVLPVRVNNHVANL